MDTYALMLGTNARLSQREIEAVFEREQVEATFTQGPSPLLMVETKEDISYLMELLGGTVKMYLLLETLSSLSEVGTTIAAILKEEDSPSFVLNTLDNTPLKSIAQSIKNTLKKDGVSSSFRLLSDPRESAGIISKYQEFLLIKSGEKVSVYKAVAVQDIDRWNKKDYDRPRSNPKSGMLPPKMARVMVNLSMRHPSKDQPVVYDPFCGSGTVLMEAMELGFYPIGSDLSQEAVEETTQNLFWYQTNFAPDRDFKVFQQDAVHVTKEKLNQEVDSIVFEGYLGPPKIKPKEVSNQIKGRKKLYKGVLKKLVELLKPGGIMVCALPEYAHSKYVKNLDSLVDDCEKFGYTQLDSPITYAREDALVRRRIYTLQKNRE